jgi:hypothetical protein
LSSTFTIAARRPSSQQPRLWMKMSAILRFSLGAVLAECGLTSTLSMSQSGESAGSGSIVATSSAAKPRWRRRSASIIASSSTTRPRAMLTSTAPGRIAASAAASIMRSVAGVCGVHSTTASAWASTACSSSCPCTASRPSSAARAGEGLASVPITRMPNALPTRAACAPMRPAPMIASVLPASSPPQ